MTEPFVVLAGALDTKGEEYALAGALLRRRGLRTLFVDVGVLGRPRIEHDVSRHEVAAAAGVTLDHVAAAGDRATSLGLMSDGLRSVLAGLQGRGLLAGALAMGGSGALTVAGPAFRALPLGVPKVVVTTMVSGDLSAAIGTSDLLVMPAIVDVAGLNRVSRLVIERAVATVAALVGVPAAFDTSRPAVALSMLGVTTEGVTAARRHLEAAGCEALVFHANGVGGRTLETLAAGGWVAGVLDLTTSELASELLGGTASAGPGRLRAAGEHGLPQVVSAGGCDLAIFGPPESVPERYAGRLLYQHNPTATLMRTSAEECHALGVTIAERLAAARGPVRVLLPDQGLSSLSVPGGPFADPVADQALTRALRERFAACEVLPGGLNDPAFARAAADAMIDALML